MIPSKLTTQERWILLDNLTQNLPVSLRDSIVADGNI